MNHSTKMPTEAQIREWKKQFVEIHKITPDPARPNIFCIVRHPNMGDVVSSHELFGTDPIKGGGMQLQNCWLYGDESIKHDIELNRAASNMMASLFRVYAREIEFLDLTDELLASVPESAKARVKTDATLRRITVKVADKSLSALLFRPTLEDVAKAELAQNVAMKGACYLQECWIIGDEELKTGSDEIKFAAYLAALHLIRTFTAEVEKL